MTAFRPSRAADHAAHRISARRAARLFALLTALLATSACGDARTSKAAPPADTVASRGPRIPAPSPTPWRSPDSYRVRVETSKGPFTIEVTRSLAPRGADRMYELVQIGYFTDVRFFRIVPGFVVQFGMHGDPAVNAVWERAMLGDEPMRTPNTRGTVAFTTAGPNTRANQLFINTADNRAKLDGQQLFAPIGTVIEGMDVVEKLNAEYGEEPNQSRIAGKGNEYLGKWYPALDFIKSATVVPPQL